MVTVMMRPQQAIVVGLCWGKGVKGKEKEVSVLWKIFNVHHKKRL